MPYAVYLKPAAERDLDALPRKDFVRVRSRILSLSENPRPPGAEKLKGEENLYRVCSEVYNLGFEITMNF